MSHREGPLKFQIAAEVRDNLVAAGQNLLGAHQNLYVITFHCELEVTNLEIFSDFLCWSISNGGHRSEQNVQLPYCTLDEIQALSKVNCWPIDLHIN